jgi:hypothetical protein
MLKYIWFLQGFTINGAPVLKNFIKVKGTFETATRATTRCPPTIIVHVRLLSVEHLAHFSIVEDILAEYYTKDDQLKIIDLPINITDNETLEKWNINVSKVVAGLSGYSHVIVFITTHSDPDSGDLWIGQDEHNNPCASSVSFVSTSIFYHFILILTINLTVV